MADETNEDAGNRSSGSTIKAPTQGGEYESIRIYWKYDPAGFGDGVPVPPGVVKYWDYVEKEKPEYKENIYTARQILINFDKEATLENFRAKVHDTFKFDSIDAEINSLTLKLFYPKKGEATSFSLITGDWKQIKKALGSDEWTRFHWNTHISLTARPSATAQISK